MQVHCDPLRRRRGRGGACAVRPAQYAELGGVRAVQPAQRAGAEAKAAGYSLHRGDVDSFSACFLPCMSPIDRHRLVSDVLAGRCMLRARLSTNSCGIGHGNSHHVGHTSSCLGIHANSEWCECAREFTHGTWS